MQRLFLLVAVMLLSGCLTAPPKEAARPTLMPRAQSYKDLTHLPAPTGKIFVSVYNIQDETGQFKPYPASNFSTAVPQSATAMLVTALKDSRWFIPLERQGLQNLLNERKIIRAAQENGTVAINNRIPLQSLTAANIMVEGSIIGYESNVKSGGVGARYFGIGADTQYQLDQIAVNLRVVNVSTGEILSSVNTSKTILSYEVQAIGDRKKFNALLFGLGNVITQCAICMRAGNGMHMKVDGIHNSLLYSIPAKDSRKPDALLVAACAVDLPADPLPFFELGNGARNVIHSFSGTGNRGDMWCYRHAWMLPERTFRR